MTMRKNGRTLVLACAASGAMALLFAARPSSADNNGCTLVGKTAAEIQVWDENADNSRGTPRVSQRSIAKDQQIAVTTSRGRIVYVYRYGAGDAWNTEVHAWCHNGDQVRVP
jgi:hypothetical protein